MSSTRNLELSLESHPRQWVDHSDAFYAQHKILAWNPTNGSWWIVQIVSDKDLKYPPTNRGWD